MNEVSKYIYNFTESELGITLSGEAMANLSIGQSVNVENMRQTFVQRYMRAGAITSKNPNTVEVTYVVTCGDVTRFGGRYNNQDVGKIASKILWRADGNIGSSAQVYIFFYDNSNLEGDQPGIILYYPESLASVSTSTDTTLGYPDYMWPASSYLPGRAYFPPATTSPTPPTLPSSKRQVTIPNTGDYTLYQPIGSPNFLRITLIIPGDITAVDLVSSKLIWGAEGFNNTYLMPLSLDWVDWHANNDTPDDNYTPPDVYESVCYTQVVVPNVITGASQMLLIAEDGSLWGWGSNVYNQLGINLGYNVTQQRIPLNLGSVGAFFRGQLRFVGGTHHHFLAITKFGKIVTWGMNSTGNCGRGGGYGEVVTSPIMLSETTPDGTIPVSEKFKMVTGTYGASAALTTQGQVYTWGSNISGQLGRNIMDVSFYTPDLVPTQFDGIANATFNLVKSIHGGHAFFYAHKERAYHQTLNPYPNYLYSWGDNAYGQLGLGDTNERRIPNRVTHDGLGNVLNNVRQISTGDNFAVILREESNGLHSVWVAGVGKVTQEADPLTPVTRFKRVKLDANTYLNGMVSVVAGWDFALALDRYGRVWSWGYNTYGQLGNGTTDDSIYPQLVKYSTSMGEQTLSGVVNIQAGSYFSIARRTNGTLWAWGANTDGQLGLGDLASRFHATSISDDLVLKNEYPNEYAVFDSWSQQEINRYDAVNDQSRIMIWMKLNLPLIPLTTGAKIYKDWTLVANNMSPYQRVNEVLRGVFVPTRE